MSSDLFPIFSGVQWRHACGFWDFPKKRDQKVIDVKFILCGPCVTMETSRKGYQFKEDQVAINIFKNWKNMP